MGGGRLLLHQPGVQRRAGMALSGQRAVAGTGDQGRRARADRDRAVAARESRQRHRRVRGLEVVDRAALACPPPRELAGRSHRPGPEPPPMATVADAPANPARVLNQLTLDFLAYLELERGLSRNTLEAYRSDLQQVGEFLGRIGRDPLSAGPPDLAAFVSELAEGRDARAPVAPATLQRKIACLRSFYRHVRR